eukprot:9389719-Prorocentrum_lima.AAC.1
MTSSLVGSEMCIRDSFLACMNLANRLWARARQQLIAQLGVRPLIVKPVTVSYTHLTLPTICSV